MPRFINSKALSDLLASDRPHALLDVREHGEFNAAHIHGASWLPRRRIEMDARVLAPSNGTLLVVCDDDGRRAALAAETLERLGYADVHVLDGGLNRWVTDGMSTEWGVNVVSKEFGERVFETTDFPEVSPDELYQWQAEGQNVVLLDSRTPEEHSFATIPGSRSLPGGELALRFDALAVAKDAKVVVHCAGRTRSIVGAHTLRRMGVPNVYGLKNGTMGWTMAGYEVESGSPRVDLPSVSPAVEAAAATRAESLAAKDGVRFIAPEDLRALIATSDQQNVYLIDPRTREEYAAGHIPGFRWFPGGQAVQRSDEVMAVRQGHVVFACDGTVRSSMSASWFRQMGFPNVYVATGGITAWAAAGHEVEQGHSGSGSDLDALKSVARISSSTLLERLSGVGQSAIMFVGTSREFAGGHIRGARWIPRGWLEFHIGDVAAIDDAVVVTCNDGVQSSMAAGTLLDLGYSRASFLDGGVSAWRGAGLPLETGLVGVGSPPNDVVLAGTERTFAEMMQYLRWEEELGHKYRSQPG
jgi:rhodanese-related sulfurtransferase